MKVAMLVSHFPPRWKAGTETATYEIARYLAKQKHKVHVVTRGDVGAPNEENRDGFYIHRIRYVNLPILGMITHGIFAMLKSLKIKPEVIQGQMISPNGLVAVLVGAILRVPSAVYVRGGDLYRSSILFKKTVAKFVLKHAKAVLVLTQDMKREAQNIVERKDIIVLPNGIDTDQTKLSGNECRKRLKIRPDERVVLFVGRLCRIKGVEYLIYAAGNISGFKVILVGDGEERSNLELLTRKLELQGRINFAGEVSHDLVREYMAASDLLVLPSLSEGFPLAILEAMSVGLPIIATKVGGIPEIVEDGKNGFLVGPRNPKQIAEKIATLLNERKLAETITENNLTKTKLYDWNLVTRQLADVYCSLTKKK